MKYSWQPVSDQFYPCFFKLSYLSHATLDSYYKSPESHDEDAVDENLSKWCYRAEVSAGLYKRSEL